MAMLISNGEVNVQINKCDDEQLLDLGEILKIQTTTSDKAVYCIDKNLLNPPPSDETSISKMIRRKLARGVSHKGEFQTKAP